MPAWSGLSNHVHNEDYSLLVNTNSSTAIANAPQKKLISKIGNRSRRGFRVMNELLDTLIGAAAGNAASANSNQVLAKEATGEGFGGARTIESRVLINRNSTANDATVLKGMFSQRFVPTSYPVDLSGNGGGGKGGYI